MTVTLKPGDVVLAPIQPGNLPTDVDNVEAILEVCVPADKLHLVHDFFELLLGGELPEDGDWLDEDPADDDAGDEVLFDDLDA